MCGSVSVCVCVCVCVFVVCVCVLCVCACVFYDGNKKAVEVVNRQRLSIQYNHVYGKQRRSIY